MEQPDGGEKLVMSGDLQNPRIGRDRKRWGRRGCKGIKCVNYTKGNSLMRVENVPQDTRMKKVVEATEKMMRWIERVTVEVTCDDYRRRQQ